MITTDNKLEVLENFFVDQSLKKKTPPRESENSFSFNEVDGDVIVGGSDFRGRGSSRNERALYGEYLDYLLANNPTLMNRIRHAFARLFVYREKQTKNVIKYESIDNFFQNIKGAVANLNVTESDLEFYTESVKAAAENGQVALFEILRDRRHAITRELALANYGKRNKQAMKYVTETDVVEFFKKVKDNGRFIKLTWMRNYTRLVPNRVLLAKNKFDEEGLFDNYVILHFDKAGDASQMTKKQKEKAKDPILFGLIRGSRKLYFVGDWTDEYCDLTLEKFLETLSQEKAKTLTATSIKNEVKSEIDNND